MFLGCKRVTLSHLASWMWLQARQARRRGAIPGSGESTRAPFHLRSVPRSTRSVPCRALLRGCNGWTVDTRRPNKCKLVNLTLAKNRWDGTRKCLFVYNIHFFCPINFFLSYNLELQKQCVSLTRRIFNTINNFSYTAYHRFCPRVILFLWSIQPFCRGNILFFAPVSQFLPLFLDFLPPFYLSCRFSSHLAPALFWASCVFDHRIVNFFFCLCL